MLCFSLKIKTERVTLFHMALSPNYLSYYKKRNSISKYPEKICDLLGLGLSCKLF